MMSIWFGDETQCRRWLDGSCKTLFFRSEESVDLPMSFSIENTHMSSSLLFTFWSVPFGPKLHLGDGANAERVRLKLYK